MLTIHHPVMFAACILAGTQVYAVLWASAVYTIRKHRERQIARRLR